MSRADPTAVLREEHRRILAIVAVLERALAEGPERGLDWQRIEACVRFLRLYADACHHAKEEVELFPALEEEGIPRDSGPVAALIEEHREGRRLLADMGAALAPARAGDAGALGRLLRAGRAYAGLIRDHIAKEDEGVFEMADRILPSSACARLCAAMDRADAGIFEGCSKARLVAIAEEILEMGG